MNIAVGVCGIGKGHSTRQYEVCRLLQEHGHNVRILTYGEGHTFFANSSFHMYDVFVPMITYKKGKLNLRDTVARNYKHFFSGMIKNAKVLFSMLHDGFVPDVCISDYEPTTAAFAYLLRKPLVTLDQQSKFIYMPNGLLDGFSCEEEKKRLSLFFPKAEKRIITSFYQLENIQLPANVFIVPPIIRRDLLALNIPVRKDSKIIVYFSSYLQNSILQPLCEVFQLFSKFPQFEFIVFSDLYPQNRKTEYSNIIVRPIHRDDFISELSNASAVISTAGHTLISEAIFCGIPYFAIPLGTYDQHYCAKVIEENKIGQSASKLTYDNLFEFLGQLSIYSHNISKAPSILSPDPLHDMNVILHHIETLIPKSID